MKICIVHNAYGIFSGEEAVVRDHAALFRAHGCEVVEFRRSSEELRGLYGMVKGFFCGIANPLSVRKFTKFLEVEKPDVVHIHNLYPLINPAILPEAKKRGIPVIMTVHNFRLFCPNGLFYVDNEICEKCADMESVIPCLVRKCLQSRGKTLGYALRHWRTNHFYWENVERFLCLTQFQRHKLIHYGIPAAKCRVLPNFIDEEWLRKARAAEEGTGDYVAFMGRLSEEKGIDLILEAAQQLPQIPFKIAAENRKETFRLSATPNVEFVGYLTGDAQFEFLRQARIHLLASRCYESFPTSLPQAMALGIPEIVPAGGPMAHIIGDAGEVFQPGCLAETINRVYGDKALLRQYREAALMKREEFTPDKYWDLYSAVIGNLLRGK
jgi:glycosyltransferase involved in cell wall biosynthesis